MLVLVMMSPHCALGEGGAKRRTGHGPEAKRLLLERMHESLEMAKKSPGAPDDDDVILMGSATVRGLFRAPRTHEPAIRMIVADRTLDLETKQLAVRLLQCLPLPAYVEFLRFVFEEIRRGDCDPSVLRVAIWPGDHWGAVIVERYQDPDVKKVLLEIKRAGIGDDTFNTVLADTLDGSYARHVQYLREESPVPFIACEERR